MPAGVLAAPQVGEQVLTGRSQALAGEPPRLGGACGTLGGRAPLEAARRGRAGPGERARALGEEEPGGDGARAEPRRQTVL